MSATTTSATTFREEWITIGNNRVLVSERDGPPGPWVRRLAMIAAWYLEGNGELDLRVVAVWLDNRHTTAYRVTIAGDCEADRHLFVSLAEILREFLSGPWVTVVYKQVAAKNRQADSYDHTEHLTLSPAAFAELEFDETSC